ncbi:hypothetical protein N2152v2_003441 [Parachlorella kessleri]
MQVTAQTLLEAYILDYLRQVGCEDLACKAGARWKNAASVPVPRTRNGILLDWWVRFWKHETRRQRELAAEAERCDLGRQAQASSPGPPSSESQLEERAAECPATCAHDAIPPRPAEQHSVSHGVHSPGPRPPSLRVASGHTSLHDSGGGWSPLAAAGGSWGTGRGSATHGGGDPDSAAPSHQAAGPVAPTQHFGDGQPLPALLLSARAAPGRGLVAAEAACSAGAEVEGDSLQLRPPQQAADGPGEQGAAHAQQGQQPQQPLAHTLSALWEDEVLDSQPRQPGVCPSGKPGPLDAAQVQQRCPGGADEGSNSCWPSDFDELGQQLNIGRGFQACTEARGKPGHAGGSSHAAAELRRPQQQHTPPRVHDLPSPGHRAPLAAPDGGAEWDCESGGGAAAAQQALLLRQRSVRPRPQPGSYAKLAQERMRTNAPRGRGPGMARGRGRPHFEGTAAAQQQRRRQHLLAQRRQAHAAAQHAQQAVLAAGGGGPLCQPPQQQQLTRLEQPAAKGSMEGNMVVAQEVLPDLPDIPEDLLTLGDPACFDQLFASSGQDDLVGGVSSLVGWEVAGSGAGACGAATSGMAGTAPAAAEAAVAAQGPPLTEEDLRGVFDDPLDMLLPLPDGGPGSLHW